MISGSVRNSTLTVPSLMRAWVLGDPEQLILTDKPVPARAEVLVRIDAVRNNIYIYGIRGEGKSATHRAEAFMREKRFDATKIHTHTFMLEDLPEAIRYARDRVEDAIKVVVKMPRRSGEQSNNQNSYTER